MKINSISLFNTNQKLHTQKVNFKSFINPSEPDSDYFEKQTQDFMNYMAFQEYMKQREESEEDDNDDDSDCNFYNLSI